MTKLGILALQGDVPEHQAAFASFLKASEISLVRRPEDLEPLDALVLPGGESTTISRLLWLSGLQDALVRRAREGLPILATCAGLILVSRTVETTGSGSNPTPLGLLDVSVRRNDYGRQTESFEGPVDVVGLRGPAFPGVFIRAPRIVSLGEGATALAHRGKEIVGARSGNVWGLSFHPELSGDPRLLELFVRSTASPRSKK